MRVSYLRQPGFLEKDLNIFRYLVQTIFSFYISWILFLRSFFRKERPLFTFIVILLYPFYTLIVPTNVAFDPFIQMRFLLTIGIYLLGVDALGSMIASNINKMPYLIAFFDNRNKTGIEGFYLSSGWSALFVGKTAMTSTGRAAIAAALTSGGVFLYQGHLQRFHESTENARQRAHESAEAARQRAYNNYTHARDQYDKSFFKRGPKPTWSEKDYKTWSD